jgi:CheY-like chemotaxis protein
MARILIVDDEVQIRILLRQILEKEGYEVDEAGDGKMAITKFQESPFDLVILDLIMPEKEGIETIIELKKRFKDTKIIAISGGGRVGPENYLKSAERLGAAYAFTKPVENGDLLTAIQKLLN